MRRTLSIATAAAVLATLVPSAAAPTTVPANPYQCRSTGQAPFWSGGVESDACDGPLPGGAFGGEAITGMDPDGTINPTSGLVFSCTVQLDRIVDGRAVPVPGAQATQSGTDPEYFDGRFCDAMGTWTPAPGVYAVTVIYRSADGRTTATMQGPAVYYPGPDGGTR